MTPKEKAHDLKSDFADINRNSFTARSNAIRCVDEIIEAVKFLQYGVEYINVRDYWAEVKEEIEKL